MKLSLNRNLAPLKSNAANTLDAIASEKLRELAGLQPIYDMKLRAAQDAKRTGDYPASLTEEAQLKGVSAFDLADAIIAKADSSSEIVSNLEIARQRAKAAVKNAASEHEITDFVNQFKGYMEAIDG